jgi:hypothetical protein
VDPRKVALAVERLAWPARMEPMPEPWPVAGRSTVLGVWRSRDYLAVHYRQRDGHERLTVNRTATDAGRWAGSIPWDDLQRVKAECGLGARWAIELYPPEGGVVDVANLRHLWLVERPACAW